MNLSTVSAFKSIDSKSAGLHELTDDELHALQRTLFDMMVDLDRFCSERNIRYSIAGGTLLGAVRHGGFIPWDDDVDLCMPRESYERLRAEFPAAMGDRYWLHTPEDTRDYGLCMARVRKKGTICRSREDVFNDECGAYLDIFIVENAPDSALFRRIHGLLSYGFGFALSCRVFYRNRELYSRLATGDEAMKRVFTRKIRVGRLLSLFSVDFWTHAWNRVNALCKRETTKNVVIPVGRAHYFREIYPREWLEISERIPFACFGRQAMFQVMKGRLPYLQQLYGDYMQIPKEQDREKHVVLEFDVPVL